MHKIDKVISGGQDGADLAGLITAQWFAIPTGGTMPKGFRTLSGNKPDYHYIYGMEQSSSREYPIRTAKNVLDSDGTIRFAFDFNSAGERRTLKEINLFAKPYYDIDLANPKSDKNRLSKCIEWLEENDIKVLNIAGNATEETYKMTCTYLRALFLKLGYKEQG